MYKSPKSRYWYISVRGVRQSSGTTDKRKAKELEDRLNAKAWEQERLSVKPARSWRELVVEWAKRKSTKASWKDDQSRLRWWDQYLGNESDIRAITRKRVDQIMREARGASGVQSSVNATANRYTALVGAMLNLACLELEWIDAAPRMPHYPEPVGNDLWLTVEQWLRLEAVLPPHLRGPVTFSLATGLRQAKVLELRWDQIDLAGRWMKFSGTENKRGNVIPLNNKALTALQTARLSQGAQSSYVWLWRGQPIKKPKVGWYNALKKAGLGDFVDHQWVGFHWHGLRHTFNSWLAQAGVPVDIRKRLCGWTSGSSRTGSISERYTHYDLDHLRPYAAVIDTILSKHSTDKQKSA